MSTERAEAILMEAIGRFIAENPERKGEIREALDAILATTNQAASVALECSRQILECREIIGNCPLSTLNLS